MITRAALCVVTLVAVLGVVKGNCPDTVFAENTQNMTAAIGDSIQFNCGTVPDLDPRFFANWEVSNFSDFKSPATIMNSVDNNINISGTVLTLQSVKRENVGFYRCFVSCPGRRTSNVASLIITDTPMIVPEMGTIHSVDTLDDISIEHRITGNPETVQVFHIINGISQRITSDTNSRFSFELDFFQLSIRLMDVRTSDGGQYRIEATNTIGTGQINFTLVVNGPDPPELNVDPFLVANEDGPIQTLCTINGEARMGSQIVWKDQNGIAVSANPSEAVYYEVLGGNAVLHIAALTNSFTGTYTCCANNSRGSDSESIDILGPPPPPGRNPTITMTGGSVTVSWTRPSISDGSAKYISSYLITIYQDDSDSVVDVIDDDSASSRFTHTITGLKAGQYTVTITSSVNNITGAETERSRFTISSSSFPVVAVAAGAAAGVFLIVFIAVVGLFGVYCFCSYKARKNQINSQHRTWSSEEDKMTQIPPSIQNTYTALSLHGNTELPPSPLSPMTSSIGIDPKWEFPRENIQLLDPLAEGQFTVLYKGMATGLIEKPCTVAVKTLKEDATEDDLKAFAYEMDVLSSIEEHPNIVSLVRVCSVRRPLYMVMEYMCHGDLLGFLRACRGHHNMYTVSPGTKYHPPALQLCSRDLLNMATKIANGMHYLADRKIVHRALCTKNILVGSGMDVKIFNVGSFDAVLDNNREGLVKWMAPETLFDGTNTTYSDVWSFGVTLWELVTLGGTPYGKMPPEDLYAQLQSGMRMPCPTHCAQEVYEIMSVCWEKNPTDRPHFSIIHDNLDDLVMSKLNYLDLKSYDGSEYSGFVDDPLRQQATVL